MAYRHEIEAVKRIRHNHPDVPQRTLARWINNLDIGALHFMPDDFNDAVRVLGSYATVYNRIRRLDGSIK